MSKHKKLKIMGKLLLIMLGLILGTGFTYFKVQGYTYNPNKAKLVYNDLVHFTEAVETFNKNSDTLKILENYFSKKSKGLSKYSTMYGFSTNRMKKSMMSKSNLYMNVAKNSYVKMKNNESLIRKSFNKLDSIYPKAIFPKTYFFAADCVGGGSNGATGLLIPVETYAYEENDTIHHNLNEIPHLVAHELIHFNQLVSAPISYISNWDNLSRAIKEGAADFIAEIISGNHINNLAHNYGNKHEKKLWEEFKINLHSNDTGEWFWVKPKENPERPQDLGYYIGYKIVESFYNNQTDKKKAIKKIIRIRNYSKFLEQSQYGKE